jgi:hypothetical protein
MYFQSLLEKILETAGWQLKRNTLVRDINTLFIDEDTNHCNINDSWITNNINVCHQYQSVALEILNSLRRRCISYTEAPEDSTKNKPPARSK